jgi:hypothetical protein
MPTLQIEHEVPNYDGWKKAFDSDPIDRKGSGVKSYRIYRLKDKSRFVSLELDFATMDELELALRALQTLWNKVQGSVILAPSTKILELVEAKDI